MNACSQFRRFDAGDVGVLDAPDTIAEHDAADAVSPIDVESIGDATLDGESDAPPVIAAPRQVAPLSTATVTSKRPTLRWMLASTADGAHVEICRDRACSVRITSFNATGSAGAPAADLPVGVVFWRLRAIVRGVEQSVTGPTWQFTVGARTAPVGTSSGTTLDLNGDGYADVVVSAYVSRGIFLSYRGRAVGAATTPTSETLGPNVTSSFACLASAGDVNGDGYGDLVVGDYGSHQVHVYLGSSTGLASTPTTTLSGPIGANSQWGFSAAGAGDVNGDGYADVVVGASGSRRAYVYLGSSVGLSAAAPSAALVGPDTTGDFGISVAGAGDVNGDGFADVIVGDRTAIHAYLYLGGATGLAAAPSASLTNGVSNSNFGVSVASAGDVNGDGYSDVVVGAPTTDGDRGASYVYVGTTSGVATTPSTTISGPEAGGRSGARVAGAGDVNGDGYGDVVVGEQQTGAGVPGISHVYVGGTTGLATTAAATLTNPDGTANVRPVAGAGDVNGDSFADIIVGSPAADRAYVHFGGTAGIAASPSMTIVSPYPGAAGFGNAVW